MTEPEEFSMINLDRLSKINLPFPPDADSIINYWIDLSQEVKIEKRVVTSLPSLFGEAGGLNDFLGSFVFLFVGQLKAKAFTFDQIKTFFRTSMGTSRTDNAPFDVVKGRTQFKKFKLDRLTKLKLTFPFLSCVCRTKRDRLR